MFRSDQGVAFLSIAGLETRLDIELRTIFLALGDLWQRADLSGGLNRLTGILLMPEMIALLFGGVCLCIIVAVSFRQRRDIDATLDALSEAMDEQSLNIEKMRRTLAEMTQSLLALQGAPGRSGDIEQQPAAEFVVSEPTAAAIRQELELLRSEILSDLSVGPSADSR